MIFKLYFSCLIYCVIEYLIICMGDFCVLTSQLHDYDTRQSNKLHYQYYRTNYGTFSIQCKGTNLWNSIFDDFKSVNSPHFFNP